MKIIASSLVIVVLSFFINTVFAQEDTPLDYGGGIILDSDLDGLTDLGEKEKFKTDPINPDTDGDGLLDGAEIIGGSDPFDVGSPYTTRIIKEVHSIEKGETPWAWYISRGTGLVAFLLLYLSMLTGLAIRIPKLNLLAKPLLAFDFHKWFSIHAIIFTLVHAFSLLFDKFIKIKIYDITIPFYSSYEPTLLALGIGGFYLMLLLTITSFLRKHMSHFVWRIIHHLNIALYIGVAVHMFYLGTDMKFLTFRLGFILLNIVLAFVLFLNILNKIKMKRAGRVSVENKK